MPLFLPSAILGMQTSGGPNGSKFPTALANNTNPSNGTLGGSTGYTYMDRRFSIGSGVTVYKLWTYLTSATTGSSSNTVNSIIALWNSSTSYTITVKTANWTHTGSGWESYTLPSPWTHPGSGTYYCGSAVNGTVDVTTGIAGDLWNSAVTQGSTYSGTSPWYVNYSGGIISSGYET